ncbi:M28 family peptidase [Mycolicibacter longobardus]|uniref:Peptidase M28 n=1 Tax=Mycolicibacter longobardus TaxID=1108812 RepID=A0A1X1YIL7_9MYCO|nr:M28 family peptidase [Mycolicibacter longobardus]MCV7384859.1 M28 family peptidase [Mycolicibacter longobardus]ORW10870.1 peptidase M28 [Mycolicibacter longobardus]
MIRPAGALLVAVGVLAGCSPEPAQPPLSNRLAGQVTVAAMVSHLQRLQEIADAHGRNRADGTPGFDASVEYVVNALRDKGFDVATPELTRLDTTSPGNPTLTVAGFGYPVDQASLLVRTPPGGVTGPVVRPTRSTGCAPADYPPTVPRGGIAVVSDAGCSVVAKQNVAAERGAAALVVVSLPSRNGAPTGLFPPNYYDQLTLPVAVTGRDGDSALRRATGPVRLVLDTTTVKITSRNILAQTRTGSEYDVVMVGAHLDGAPGGPGINDNGSGVAAVLETALQLGPSPAVTNAVRFAFWAAEERQLGGSTDYVFGLDRDQLNDIALYLNFDMLASPNPGYFTYDGDQSALPSRDITPDDVPAGSAGVERTLAGYLNLVGVRPADMPLSSDTDYSPFVVAGVPIGGITTGASQLKTTAQARLWGGKAGAPFDPNYHGPGDTVEAINQHALALTGSAVAFAVANYAQSIGGPNGVPPRDKRHRAPLGP